MADFDIDQLLEQSLTKVKQAPQEQPESSSSKRPRSKSPERDSKRRRDDRDERRDNDKRRDGRDGRDSRDDRRDYDRDRRGSSSRRDRSDNEYDRERDRGGRGSSRKDDKPAPDSVAAFVPNRTKEKPLSLEEIGDRDARTVFAYNLPTKASEREIIKFFERAGKVRDVRLITDRNSRRSKGFGYIEMDTMKAVSEAIQLSGTSFMGKTVMVQASQSEKNGPIASAQAVSGPTRLYVSGLHANITEADVSAIFLVFGDVDFVHLHREPETGISKGFAFVQFRSPESAKRALVQVNGQELAGRPLKVGVVSEGNKNGTAAFEEEDGEGAVALDSVSRAILMEKLTRPGEDRHERNSQVAATSPCLWLKNMFSPADPEVMTNPAFEQELTDDVKDECARFGVILHVYVDRFSTDGSVYMRFGSTESASKAFNELNGRWFAGLQIAVQYILEGEYLRKFPAAR